MEISVGHTPDSDDAFMFYGMLTGKISSDFTVKHVIGDIEELNKKAINPELDVTAVSVHACAYLPCLLYTSPSPRDGLLSRMPSSA